MIITLKMLEELRKILAEQPLVVKDDDDLTKHGLAIMRFVLCKERHGNTTNRKNEK